MKKVLISFMLTITLIISMFMFSSSVLATDFEVELGSVQCFSNSIVTMPIRFKNIPSKGILSCDFTVYYDKNLLEAVDNAVTAGPITNNSSLTFDSIIDKNAGTIKFLYCDETGLGDEAITSDGVFADVKFLIKSSIPEYTSKVSLQDDPTFSNTDLELVTTTITDGSIEVISKGGYKLSGYITPDLSVDSTVAEMLKSDFNVNIAGTGLMTKTDKNGFFEIYSTNEMEECVLEVSKSGFLSREIKYVSFKNSNGSTEVSTMSSPLMMYVGDFNNDRAINMIDIMFISKSFNTLSGDSGYKSECDVNKDGSINMADVVALAKHFNCVTEDYK